MATASTKSVAEVSNVFDCSICLEKLKIPKYLPCLHTYCESCIQSYIESTAAFTDQTQQSDFWINCPVCRNTVTCTDKNTTIKNWAKRLPINHLIMSLMDSNFQVKEHKSKMCTSCERKGMSEPAELWCKQCSDALCGPCCTNHSAFRALMNHEILPLENIVETDAMIPDIDEPCPFHRGKYLEVFCLDHRKLCCSICFATQHRTCSDVLSIEEVSQREGVQSSADTMMNNLSTIAEIVDKAIKEKSDNIQAIESKQETELGNLALAIDDIKHSLDTLYQDFKKNVNITHDEQRSKLLAISEQLKGFEKTVSNDCQLLKAVISQGNAKQIFLTTESLRHQIIDHFSRIASVLESDKEIHLKFTRNKVLDSISNMKNLVDIEVISNDIKTNCEISDAMKQLDRGCFISLSVSEKSEPCDPVLTDDPYRWTVNKIYVFNTKVANEYTYGGTFLLDGKLVLADNNQKLKVFDTLGNLYTSFSMTSNPYDITRASEAQMFYVTHDGNTFKSRCVSLCKLTSDINIMSTFQAPDGVTGISYTGDVLVLGSGSHVYTVSSKDGTIIHKVSAGIDGAVAFVTASPDSDRLIHADGNSVVCRTLKMEEIFRYSDKKISKTRGVAFDIQQNVYVCEWISNKIVQIKRDGSDGQILPISLQAITAPYCIGFQPDGKTFFVGDVITGYVEVHTLTKKTT